MLSFILWYLAVSLFGLLALPLTFRFFEHLPDRGYAFSKPLGVLGFSYLFWISGSLGLLRNNAGGLFLALILLAGMGALAARGRGLAAIRDWLREQRRYVFLVELLFLTAFAGWALVRAYDPNIFGTEKPMEFMFINSILRSPNFPPHDAWLSGHAISYYYFGYVIIAALARLTGAASAVAFNLGLALLFALTAVAALGVTVNLIGLARRLRSPVLQQSPASLPAAFWPALLGPLLVLLVGNFYGALELAHDNGLLARTQVPAVYYDFGDVQGDSIEAAGPPGVRAGLINFWRWLDLKRLDTPPPSGQAGVDLDLEEWFFAARVVHDRNLIGVETEAIDENPAFSFVLGDMHPHVLALPFVILSIGLALEWLLWGRELALESAAESPPRFPPLDWLLFSGVLLGGLAAINTWDFPIYWFLVLIALVIGLGSGWGWQGLVRAWSYPMKAGASLLITGVLLYFPFYLTFQSQAGGILPNLIYPTRFQQTFVMFGPVLLGVSLFLGWCALRRRERLDGRAAVFSGLGIVALLALAVGLLTGMASLNPTAVDFVDQVIAPLSRDQAWRLLWQRRLVDSLATIYPAAVIGLSMGLLVGALRRIVSVREPAALPVDRGSAPPLPVKNNPHPAVNPHPRPNPGLNPDLDMPAPPALLMALAMVLTGALLLIGPEFLYLRDNFGTRMNTLFKFYFQAWVLWALVSAFGLWYLFAWGGRLAKWFSGIVMALAIVLGLIYTYGGIVAKTGGFAEPPTLDGMAYFARSYPNDWAAIQWLDENVDDAPVILEGTRGAYWVEGRSSRISMATGLPTVMGWVNHESQWRGPYFSLVADREGDIRTIYQSRSWEVTKALLDRYDVKYVLVSDLEREFYQPVFDRKFEAFMEPVYQVGDVTIYER